MYKVTKRFTGFSCCFRQWRAESHCRNLHGYAIEFEIVFSAINLDKKNWVIDFGGFDKLKKQLAAMFDHTLVVAESDPNAFDLQHLDAEGIATVRLLPEVGCEVFARLVYQMANQFVADLIPPNAVPSIWGNGVKVVSVKCIENNNNSATYEP